MSSTDDDDLAGVKDWWNRNGKPLLTGALLAGVVARVPSSRTLRARRPVCAVGSVITVLSCPSARQMILPIWPWSL
mgnify:CR=1 FL=1